MASNRKARSLNDSHYRLLQDLTTPRPKNPNLNNNKNPPAPSFSLDDEEESEVSSPPRFQSDHDIPQFSAITDFDSPSPLLEEEKPAKPEEVKQRDSEQVQNMEIRKAVGFEHKYSNTKEVNNQGDSEVLPQVYKNAGDEGASGVEPRLSGVTNENKPVKVKIAGRRRLCKLSSKDDDQRDSEQVKKLGVKEAVGFVHKYSDVKEENDQGDSEVLPRDYRNAGNEGASVIEPRLSGVTGDNKPVKVKIAGRRRICKLSSKDDEDSSSAAAFDVPRPSDMTDFDSPALVKNDPESDRNDCGGGNNIRDIFNDLSSRLELLSIEKKRVPKERVPYEDHSLSKDDKKIDEENNGDFPEYASAGSSFSTTPDKSDSSSDAAKHHVEGGPNLFDNSSASSISVIETNAQKVSLSLCQSKKLESLGRSQYDMEEDDGDCAAFKKRSTNKQSGRTMTTSEEYVHSDIVDISDDCEDESTETDDESDFILRGQKSNYKLPRKIAKILYSHQIDGLKWLWSLHCKGKGGILGDDMGLGKTMQICGFLAGLFHSNLIKRAMVVAPKTLLSHWIKELSAVGLSDKIREYFGTCPKARQYELQYVLQDKGVLLTTYDIVRNNSKSLCGNYYFKDDSSDDDVLWDYMLLDEGHLIKNPGTQRAKSLLEIPSAHRIIISGTPIQNNLRELWALFSFCCPELLGDKKEFKEKYEDLILRGNDKRATEREKRIGSTVAKDLRECIKPYFLRRLKSEVFQEDDVTVSKISKKNEIIVWLRLTGCQRRLYEAFLNSELVLSSFDHSPLAALTIIKKICDHPLLLTKRAAEDVLEGMESMVNPEDVGMAEKLAMYIADIGDRDEFQESHDRLSCKISFIISLLDNLIPEGHNVLIFSQTRKMLNLIQESLTSNGYEYLRIDGTTKASDRIRIVNDFQEGRGAPIFLLTSQVGGLGLTLTKADRVIVVDPAWNPSTDNQSVDRAYRIGQKKDVIVYRLMTCGTVEEKIYRKQIYKGGLFKTATEHKEQIRYFSQQDLKELFSLPKEGFDVSPTQRQLLEEHDHLPTLDGSLKAHIEFLETLGIAGVSHHSLLYSKAAPVQVVDVEEVTRGKTTSSLHNSSSRTQVEHYVDGAAFAFNPKDVKANKKNHTLDSAGKLSESEIKERINRLSRMLADKVTISRLPDKGEKLQKQIVKLNLELENLRMARTEKEVIDLDDISGNFQKLNV